VAGYPSPCLPDDWEFTVISYIVHIYKIAEFLNIIVHTGLPSGEKIVNLLYLNFPPAYEYLKYTENRI
jgi:hypothetical protein